MTKRASPNHPDQSRFWSDRDEAFWSDETSIDARADQTMQLAQLFNLPHEHALMAAGFRPAFPRVTLTRPASGR